MLSKIDDNLALQVVNTVKDVCGQDVNFIDKNGMIFASTNAERIGTFHEIGYRAARTGDTIEVTSDDSFTGTKKGINMPVYHNHSILAVIGISGEPEDVRKYAHLARRITDILIRERELSQYSRNQADKRQYVIDSLLHPDGVNLEYLRKCLDELAIDQETPKRLLLFQIHAKYNEANLPMLEYKLNQLFQVIGITLFTFHYPNEYLAVVDDEHFTKRRYALEHFAKEYGVLIQTGVGKACHILQLVDSFETAQLAYRSIRGSRKGLQVFDELTLEILFARLREKERQAFLEKTVAGLEDDAIRLLQVYFEEDLSLQATSERLFLHKNTLQYRLNAIARKTGLNPRSFREAVLLYLGTRLSETAGNHREKR